MSEFVSGSRDSVIFWENKSYRRKRSAQPFANTEPPSSITWNVHNTNVAVVPGKGDTVAMCDLHDGAANWTHFHNPISGDFTSGCLLRNKYFASGSSDSVVRMWDIKTKDVFRTFHGQTSSVRSLCRSSRDNWLVSGGEDGAIVVHVVDSTTSPIHCLQDPSTGQQNVAINRLKFSHVDKTKFGSVNDGGMMCLWSVESLRKLSKFSLHAGKATDICFSPANNMLVISVGIDARIRCYDVQTRRQVQTEVDATIPLTSCTLFRDGVTLVVGAETGEICVYDLRTIKQPKTILYGHSSAVSCIVQQWKVPGSSSRSSPRSPAMKTRHRSDILGKADSADNLSDVPNSVSPLNSHEPHSVKDEDGPPMDGEDGRIRESESAGREGVVSNDVIAPSSRDATMATHMIDDDRVMATPIMDDTTHLNSIFSPIDPNLVTPLTRHHPMATIGVPSSSLDSITYSYHPTHMAPAASEVTATVSALSSSSSQAAAPSPIFTSSSSTPITSSSAFSCATPSTHTMPPLSVSSETSDLFSPLPDSSSSASRLGSVRQPVASPLLIAHSKPSSVPVDNALCHVTHPKATTNQGSSSTPVERILSTSGALDYPDSAVVTKEGVHSSGNPLPARSQGLPSSMVDTLNGGGSSSTPELSTAAARTSSRHDTHLSTPRHATPPANDIQMKFVENFIREAHEETRETLHDDIRAINVDFIKIFHALLHQMSVLTERVDKLAQDMEYLKSRDPLYPYIPKH